LRYPVRRLEDRAIFRTAVKEATTGAADSEVAGSVRVDSIWLNMIRIWGGAAFVLAAVPV